MQEGAHKFSGSADMQSSIKAHRSSAACRNLASALDSSSDLSKNGLGVSLCGILVSLEHQKSDEGGVDAAGK